MYFSDYLKNKILDSYLGNVAFTIPANLYFACMVTTPGSDGLGGVEVSTTTSPSYARKVIANGSGLFASLASGGTKATTLSFDFGTATEPWGTVSNVASPITGVAVYDGSGGGANLLFVAELQNSHGVATPQTVLADQALGFSAGGLSWSIVNPA